MIKEGPMHLKFYSRSQAHLLPEFLKRMQEMYSGFVNLPGGKKLSVKNQSWYIRSKAPPVMAL